MSYLNQFERRVYSQNGEDGILLELIRLINPVRFFVEFGVESGIECNTRVLKHDGWVGVCWDGGNANHDWNLYQERVTAENINALFSKYHVPCDLGVLSIDIDGNDFHVWRAIDERYRPSIVIIEYNASVPLGQARTIPYDPAFRWDFTSYYGASFSAIKLLGIRKGYSIVCTDTRGVNAFLVRDDLLHALPQEVLGELVDDSAIYHPVGYGQNNCGHNPDHAGRPWDEVT